ncbi:hypothetical protein [Alicyclobacillus kakegawensis]|uniref:hypothetical protein n=1 Tax=Alicyclobacillus kakegawensis TaxID=392012 RepID=UPI000ACBA967|nr:hypothetical protein [Alicyclobacillus kakegawensis]
MDDMTTKILCLTVKISEIYSVDPREHIVNGRFDMASWFAEIACHIDTDILKSYVRALSEPAEPGFFNTVIGGHIVQILRTELQQREQQPCS